MDTSPFPPLANLNLSTHVQLTAHCYEHAVLKSLLASAHATGDATFRVFRLGQMTLRMDPPVLIDRLALRQDWVCLRVNSHTLIVRAANLFGIVEAMVSQRELIFSRLFNDLRLFDGKRIKMNFPFRAAICQHIVSKIGVGKSTQCGAPGSAPFENAINSGISRLRFFNHSCPFHLIMSLTRLNEGIGRHLMKLTRGQCSRDWKSTRSSAIVCGQKSIGGSRTRILITQNVQGSAGRKCAANVAATFE
jgi:hypothetical protein